MSWWLVFTLAESVWCGVGCCAGFFVVLGGLGCGGFLCVWIHKAGRYQDFFDLILLLAMLRKEKQGDVEGTVVKVDNNRLDEIFENFVKVNQIIIRLILEQK